MEKKNREILGYLLGLVLFIVLIPALMVRASPTVRPEPLRLAILIVLAAAGIGLSIWSIIHMKRVGKGNPMDAFNHEIAPRTSELMTDGPYRLCRNPMLLGVFLFYIGILVYLRSWQALLIFAVFFVIMMVQVEREEKRLEEDFGEAYREYKRKTAKLIPYIW